MAEKRAKKAAEEAKEAQANEQIRRKSGKVLDLFALLGDGTDCRASQGYWAAARRAQGKGNSEGYGKEKAG